MKDNDKQVLIKYRIQQAWAALEEADFCLSMGKQHSAR